MGQFFDGSRRGIILPNSPSKGVPKVFDWGQIGAVGELLHPLDSALFLVLGYDAVLHCRPVKLLQVLLTIANSARYVNASGIG